MCDLYICCIGSHIQSNLVYPNVDYPNLLGYSKTTDNPDLFSLLSIAIKLLIIRILIIRKIEFFEVIRRSRLKKLLLITLQDSKSKCHAWLFGRV